MGGWALEGEGQKQNEIPRISASIVNWRYTEHRVTTQATCGYLVDGNVLLPPFLYARFAIDLANDPGTDTIPYSTISLLRIRATTK